MDISKLLKRVNNLNDYISVSQEVLHNFSDFSKVQFNVSTVCALNKIRSNEIEYFNKYGENGAALRILELILQLPPSKTWYLLGKELITLLQYWLDAVRKHLIEHNNNWWNFLSVIIKFIQEIRSKHLSMNNILVEHAAECLLDIATRAEPELHQRYKIIQCLNSFCAEAGRQIRCALRNKLDIYFIKLSKLLATCGDIPLQYSIIETLLRWLLPRQDLALRRQASARWFPNTMYGVKAVDIFLKRTWQNFFKDARGFLNALNETSDVVLSVLCRKFIIGSVVLVSGKEKNDYWIDMNCGSKCVSMMLESRLFQVLHSSVSFCNALVIGEDNTDGVQMLRQSSEILIKLIVRDPHLIYPSGVLEGCDVTIAVSTNSDTRKVDRTLRNIFDTKYQLLLNLEDSIEISPQIKRAESRRDKIMDDDSRFSNPVETLKRGKHSGYIVRPKNPESWQSPSTASTSSLAMLREKLTAFPGISFDKEPLSVCALPQLSNVTEVSEPDDKYSFASKSTLKLRTYGVCHRNNKVKPHSDTDCVKTKVDLIENKVKDTRKRCISPVDNDENAVSCLLVATIGSADDSVINDTLERLPKHKEINTDNIIEMLALEALNARKEVRIDSGIDCSNKIGEEQNNDTIENTQFITEAKQPGKNKRLKQVNSSTDESNTEFVEVSKFTNKDNKNNANAQELKTFDNQQVEDFFSQHFNERYGDLVISPSLAKKINETSSECSYDIYSFMNDDNQIDIVECLNEMVDIVCRGFDKCTEFLDDCQFNENNVNKTEALIEKNNEKSKRNTKAKNIKLKYPNKKQTKPRAKKKLDKEPVKRMSPIIERHSVIEKNNSEIDKNTNDFETPLIKRKRKLYSPKYDNLVNEKGIHISETEEDTILSNTKLNDNAQRTLAASYKDIENIRRKSLRKLRDRKSRSAPSLSPRAKKMNDVFDNLIKTNECEEKVVLVNRKTRNKKFAVYNFSSDSDDDFEVKEKKKKKNKANEGAKVRRKRNNAKINYSEINNSTDDQNNRSVKRKRTKRSYTENKNFITKSEIIDERMRGNATEILNSSFIIEPQNEESVEQNPVHFEPQMEFINEKENLPKNKKIKQNTDLSSKKGNKSILSVSDRDNTTSPLPGLIVETVQEDKESDKSIKVLMLTKFNDEYQDILPDVTNTTQNLLSDLDRNNNSPIRLNITDEFNKISNNQKNVTPMIRIKMEKANKNENKSKTTIKSVTQKSKSNEDIINLTDNTCGISEKSIETVGKSPITAHGDFDESPPSTRQLKQIFHPRGLETQDFDKCMKDYFDTLTNELNKSEKSSNKSNSLKEIEKTTSKESIFKVYPAVSISRLSPKEISKWLPSRYNSVFDSNQSSDSVSLRTRSQTRKSFKSKDNANNSKDVGITYKSIISPVKLFGELNSKEKPNFVTSNDDYVDRIKSLLTTKKNIYNEISVSKSPRYELRNQISGNSKNSQSSEDSDKSVKRKSSPVIEVKKKMKIDSAKTESAASGSSVIDWLKRNEDKALIDASESLDLSVKDNLENIMEKLNTTMVEIHHMTSKKFVSMFVDTQIQLNELKEQRREMLRDTAKRVLSKVVEIFDNEFDKFNKSSKELDEQFLESVKEKARNLIHEDCKQKRIMISMLKEDVQAALEQSKRRRTAN